jgi:hypothetical protein
MSSMDRPYFFGTDIYLNKRVHGYEKRRLFLVCWDLQSWPAGDFEALAGCIRDEGIDGFVDSQLPNVWEDAEEVGDAMQSLFEGL